MDLSNNFHENVVPGSSLIPIEKLAATIAKIMLACKLASLLTI